MPLILPARFASLADAAATESTRYAMTGVHVKVDAKQSRLTATDSRILLDVALPVKGPEVATYGEEFPKSPALDAAPNSATVSLVDADLWRSMRGKRARRAAIVLGDKITTVGTVAKPDKTATAVDVAISQASIVEGRFPPADEIIRQTSEPWARFTLSAGHLAKLLKALAGVINQDDDKLDFEIREPGKPIVIKAIDPVTAAAVTGIIMPMTGVADRTEERRRQGEAEILTHRVAKNGSAVLPPVQAATPAPVAAQADQGDTVTVDREEYERMLRMARTAGYTPLAD